MSDYGGGFQFTFGTAEGQPHHQPQPYQPTQAHDASSVYVSRGGAVTYPTLPQQPQQQPQELVNMTYSVPLTLKPLEQSRWVKRIMSSAMLGTMEAFQRALEAEPGVDDAT